jgi:negative regulator of sigma E activity
MIFWRYLSKGDHMVKTNWNGLARTIQRALSKNAPEILTGVGIAGMITTTVLAVRATPKATRLIDEKKKEEKQEKLTLVQTVRTAGTCYVPAAVTGAVSIACLIGANTVNGKRNAALAAAYQLSESAARIYREKVIETIGEKKEALVRDEVAKEQLARANINPQTVVIVNRGNTLIYDPVSNRAFYSNWEAIMKAMNDFNYRLASCMYLSENDFLELLGLAPWENGDHLGWVSEKPMDIQNPPSAATIEGMPALVITHYTPPDYRFKDPWNFN